MSFDALAWAARQNTGSSATKLVLLGLAECASRPEAYAFPSTAALVEFSSLDRKTVVKAVDQLEREGFIRDTGKRMGRTSQVKVYQLKLDVAGRFETVPETEASQKRDALKGSQNSHQRLPKTVHGISKGISTSRAKALSVRAKAVDDLDLEKFQYDAVEWGRKEMGWTLSQANMEFNRFADSARQHGRTYKDWQAAWRNWCRSPFCKTVSAKAAATAYRNEPMRV